MVWKRDRLGRSVRNLIYLVSSLQARDVQFKSLTDAIGQIHTVRNGCLIRLLCQRKQFLHFGLQLPLHLFDMFVGQSLMLGGVGVNLGAIQADPANL